MSDVITILVGVLIAGALGTALRVLVADPDAVFSRQVMGTLVDNVVGSFALGVISALDGNTALIIGVGGLGAFTTFRRSSPKWNSSTEKRRENRPSRMCSRR